MNKLLKHICLLLPLWGTLAGALSAREFTPAVRSFDKRDYGADSQNWAVTQTSDGMMYFGNGKCLLAFDGLSWQSFMMPHGKSVRSVYAEGDRIYVGSYEEFGYFGRNEDGAVAYVSLSESLVDWEMSNDEIWTIMRHGEDIVFQAFASWFLWSEEKGVRAVRSPEVLLFFNSCFGKIFSDTESSGLAEVDLETGELAPVPGVPFSSAVVAMLPRPDGKSIAVTYSDGLYLYDGESFSRFRTDFDTALRNAHINRAVLGADGNIVLGTLLDGAFSVSAEGRGRWHINASGLLPGNTVLGLFCGRDGNVWMALDSGIAIVYDDMPVSYIRSLSPAVGAIYASHYKAPWLYLGTNQGLYFAKYDNEAHTLSDIRLAESSAGHVWHISAFGDQVFCGTNRETYEISGGVTLSAACPVEGGMCMAFGIVNGRPVIVQGTYTHLCIYTMQGGRWKFSHRVEGFIEPVSTVQIDHTGRIWAGHLHEGLYALRLSENLREVASVVSYGSVGDGPVSVFGFDGRVIFTSGNGFWTYDDIEGVLTPFSSLDEALGVHSDASCVCMTGHDTYWFTTESDAVMIKLAGGHPEKADAVPYGIFESRTVDGHRNVARISDETSLITLENSVAVYDSSIGTCGRHPSKLFIGRVSASAPETSETMVLPLASSGKIRIPYRFRNLEFVLRCPSYAPLGGIVFIASLEGLDKSPVDYGHDNVLNYNHLPYGNYKLTAEAVSPDGTLAGEVEYEFSVEPPFYLSLWAKMIYVLAGFAVAVLIFSTVRRNAARRRSEMMREHSEKLHRMETERLESEIRQKSKELSATTMNLIRKNEILIRIKDELMAQKQALGTQYPKVWYNKVVGIIDSHLEADDDWEVFQKNFDRIHENFFRNLQERYPELTPNDLKFCACLRLNLSSKDIASFMNISLKGVEAARSRIRRKISLPSELSLSSFFINFK